LHRGQRFVTDLEPAGVPDAHGPGLAGVG
jgi:hypothetical protein